MTDPGIVMTRLGEIEVDLGNMQNAWETAAGEHARLHRDWKKREHICMGRVEGGSEGVKKSKAFVMACEQDDLYDRLTAAEEGLAKAKVLYEVLDRRASIGQSILKAMTAEQYRTQQPPERAYSRAA